MASRPISAVEPEREAPSNRSACASTSSNGRPAAPPLPVTASDRARFATLRRCSPRAIASPPSPRGRHSGGRALRLVRAHRDIVAVMRTFAAPVHLIGHSMGGGHVTDAARALPELVRRIVNIDGFGPPPLTADEEARTPERFAGYLDQRRAAAQRLDWRPYASLDQLIERRRAQNPRLGAEWLRYFVFHAARQRADGWRWKADPLLAQGFGPWRPDWIEHSYARLRAPLLAVMGSENDTWGPLPEAIVGPRLAGVARLQRAVVAGAGHFVHMERPRETAQVLLDYLEN
jgi:pimeloyl-ACP methyl ester carboxylesterase